MDGPIAAGAMHIYARLTSGLEALTRWSDEAHHRESLQRPGWLSIRRFAAVPLDGCAGYEGFDLLTEIEVASVDAAALIADHSYTPTPMPAGIVGLKAARAVYERLPQGASAHAGDPLGVALLYVVTELPGGARSAIDAWRERDPLPAALRDAGCVGVTRSRWIDSPATTLARTTTGPRVLAQYEVADVAQLAAVVAAMPPENASTSRRCAAYRQVFPDRGRYTGSSEDAADAASSRSRTAASALNPVTDLSVPT